METIFSLAGILTFLFLFWKKLKEDYLSSIIFTSAFSMLLGVAAGLILSKFFFPSYWFWASLVGITIGLLISARRFNLRIYEASEAAVISLLPWAILVSLADAISASSLGSLIEGVSGVLLIGLYIFLDRHYKNFTWYASGRVGFSGLTVLAIFFLLRGTIAIFTTNVLSFVEAETAISEILAFAFFLLVFNLSRQKV